MHTHTYSIWPFESPTECGFYIFIIDDLLKRLRPFFVARTVRKRARGKKGEFCVFLAMPLIALGFELRIYASLCERVCVCACERLWFLERLTCCLHTEWRKLVEKHERKHEKLHSIIIKHTYTLSAQWDSMKKWSTCIHTHSHSRIYLNNKNGLSWKSFGYGDMEFGWGCCVSRWMNMTCKWLKDCGKWSKGSTLGWDGADRWIVCLHAAATAYNQSINKYNILAI